MVLVKNNNLTKLIHFLLLVFYFLGHFHLIILIIRPQQFLKLVLLSLILFFAFQGQKQAFIYYCGEVKKTQKDDSKAIFI